MSASSVGFEHRQGVIRIVPETDGIVAVCLEGEFDLANALTLSEKIDRALGSWNNLILDLSETTFIDSSVTKVLVQAAKVAAGRKQTMVLQLGTAAAVERILEIIRIDQVLPRAHDRQEAVRIIQSEPHRE